MSLSSFATQNYNHNRKIDMHASPGTGGGLIAISLLGLLAMRPVAAAIDHPVAVDHPAAVDQPISPVVDYPISRVVDHPAAVDHAISPVVDHAICPIIDHPFYSVVDLSVAPPDLPTIPDITRRTVTAAEALASAAKDTYHAKWQGCVDLFAAEEHAVTRNAGCTCFAAESAVMKKVDTCFKRMGVNKAKKDCEDKKKAL
jgi:hypothetical protein